MTHGIDPLPSCKTAPGDSLSKRVRLRISEILRSDEELIWAGMPKQGLQWPELEGYTLPSILLIGLQVIFVICITFSAPPLILMLPIISVIWFYSDGQRRENTLYGLTNKRIIILLDFWWWPNCQTLFLTDITDIYLNEHPDGSGTIRFGNDPWYTGFMRRPREYQAPRFEMLREVRSVFDLVVTAHKAAKNRVAPPAWM